MDLIAGGEGVGTQFVRCARLEVDVRRGASGLQDGIKTLPRPGEPLAQLLAGDAIVVRGKALIGSLALLPEAMGLDEPCALLVVIKAGTQGFPDRGVARGGAVPRRGLPIEHAIQALEEVGGQADTDDPRLVLGMLRHGFSLGACPRKKSLKNNAFKLRRDDFKISHFSETRVLTGGQNFCTFLKNL